MSKRISEVKAICELLGMTEFKIVNTSGGHLRIESATELLTSVVTSNSPSDNNRSNKNLKSTIRKHLTPAMLENLDKIKKEKRGGTRTKFNEAVKSACIKRMLAGEKIPPLSEETGVGKSTLSAWKAKALKSSLAPVSDSKSSLIKPMRLPEDCKKTSQGGAMDLTLAINYLQSIDAEMQKKTAEILHLMKVNESVRAERDEAITKLALIKETIGMK